MTCRKTKLWTEPLPKLHQRTLFFLKTYTLFDWLVFVICIDSLGYEEVLHHLLVLLLHKDNYQVDYVVMGWAKVQDEIKAYMQKWQKTKEERIKWTLDRKELLMLKCLNDNQANRKGDRYYWGIGIAMLPDSFGDCNGNVCALWWCKYDLTPEGRQRKAKQWQKETECKHCHETMHLCVTSLLCRFNKYNLAKVAAEAKAAAEANGGTTPTHMTDVTAVE